MLVPFAAQCVGDRAASRAARTAAAYSTAGGRLQRRAGRLKRDVL
jgi:hypothetical protein